MSEPKWTQEMFSALTLHSADIISLLDAEGRLIFSSPATLRINGFTPEELLDQDTFELIHPDDRAAVFAVFAEVLSAPGTIRTVEYRSLTKDGRWLWMEAVARNEVDNPAVRGVVANSRDISDRKRADAERHKLEQQLLQAQKLESLGVLAGGVAHDFNNLLAIILAELGQLEPRTQTEQEAVSHIDNAARRAADLATQLLTYAGRREQSVESTDLVALIRELEPLLRLSARGEATLRLELAPSTSAVRCDRGQVRQILLNLVINATEALAGPGTVTVRLGERTVEVEELARGVMPVPVSPGRAVVLEVEDTGAGMAEDTLQRIFEPFFSTRQTGRGLGLAAVTGIVRRHGAGLRVESAPGQGARFSLYFQTAPAATQPPGPGRGRFAGKVLVIDDEPMVARSVARLLTRLGFSTTTATSGEQAIELLSSTPTAWALVVCDVLMPGLSGAQTVTWLRTLRPDVPVVFVSGYVPEAGQLPGGRTAVLAKPFSDDVLIAALSTLVPEAVDFSFKTTD